MVWTSIKDSISRQLAFMPPAPPSYRLERHGDGAREVYLQPEPTSGVRKVPSAQAQVLRTRKGEDIVALFVPQPRGASAAKYTLLHSHGNAVDLGQMAPMLAEMARLLHVNIAAYDYTGYGRSSGVPAVSSTLADVERVLEWLKSEHGLSEGDIVLYGQSVGSGPTCHLAARTPGLAGVVLHSGFLSGYKVLNPESKRWPAWADIYPNYKLVPRIDSRLLVMHGTTDDVIAVTHGQQLAALARRPSEPLFPHGCSHHNVESCPEYIPRLRSFLAECWGEGYRRHLGAACVRVP